MNKKRTAFLAGVCVAACMAMGIALTDGNVSAKADGTSFEMIGGASIRLAEDGNYGIRYAASLGVTSEEAIGSTYGENSVFHVMIIPADYYTTYLSDVSEGGDYYQALYNALYDAETNPEPYIAAMEAEPFLPAANSSLAQNVYHVQGSLTSLQYGNLNRNFVGLAYYETTTDGGTTRTYASFPESDVKGVTRNIVNVASKTLNAGEYADGSDEDGVLDGYIRQGINQASGVSEENKDQSVDETLEKIGVNAEKKTLDKAEAKLEANNMPAGVEIDVAWSAAQEQTVIDGNALKNGTVKPNKYGDVSVTAKILGKSYSCTVQSRKSDDWSFNSNAEDDSTGYDFGSSSYRSAYVSSAKAENGTLQMTYGDNQSYGSTVFYNDAILDKYNAGDLVRATMRLKYLDKDGKDVNEDDMRVYAFVGEGDNGIVSLKDGVNKTYNGKNVTVTADGEWRILSWDASVNDYYWNLMYKERGSTETGKKNIAYCHVEGGGYTILIDYITVTDIVTYEVENQSLLTAKTHGGNVNSVNSSVALTVTANKYGKKETVDASKLTYTSSDEAIAKVVNGQVIAGKAGKATIGVSGAADENSYCAQASSFTVEVKTAISSKYDLDMLGLAYALGRKAGKYASDTSVIDEWSSSASYVLTNDIDYDGAIFIPIAAQASKYIGKQWKTVLENSATYGISYDEFKSYGLNRLVNGGSALDQGGNTYYHTGFNGTLDGNGYSIKNAKLMLDASLGVSGTTLLFKTNAIGVFDTQSKIVHIGFENFTIQTQTEAGYNQTDEYTVDATDGTTQTGKIGAGSHNACGLWGSGVTTMEDVYAEFAGSYGTFFIGTGNANLIFGRWIGATAFKNCVFVDTFKDVENYKNFNSIQTNGNVTGENLIFLSNTDASGEFSGTVMKYASVTALVEAKNAEGSEIGYDGFDSDIWDTSGDLPKLRKAN